MQIVVSTSLRIRAILNANVERACIFFESDLERLQIFGHRKKKSGFSDLVGPCIRRIGGGDDGAAEILRSR